MYTIQRFRTSSFAIVAWLTIAVSAPIAVNAEEQALAVAPAPEQSWDETSGYASVERTRAEVGAMLSGETISGHDPAVALAAAEQWDETSGYGAVEATRAARSGDGGAAAMDAAERLAQFRAVELAMSRFLGTASDVALLAGGTCAE